MGRTTTNLKIGERLPHKGHVSGTMSILKVIEFLLSLGELVVELSDADGHSVLTGATINDIRLTSVSGLLEVRPYPRLGPAVQHGASSGSPLVCCVSVPLKRWIRPFARVLRQTDSTCHAITTKLSWLRELPESGTGTGVGSSTLTSSTPSARKAGQRSRCIYAVACDDIVCFIIVFVPNSFRQSAIAIEY